MNTTANRFKTTFDNWPILDGSRYIEADMGAGVTVRAYVELDQFAQPYSADDLPAFNADTLRFCELALNVYIGGDHLKRVTAEWLDGGRVLKLETNLFIEGQQGDHAVHLYDEFRLSADGRTLKLYELRSTRDEPLVYYFTRQ